MCAYDPNKDCEQSTTELDGRFLHSQLLIACLLRMESSQPYKDILSQLATRRLMNLKTIFAAAIIPLSIAEQSFTHSKYWLSFSFSLFHS